MFPMFMYLQGYLGGNKSMSPSWGEYPRGMADPNY